MADDDKRSAPHAAHSTNEEMHNMLRGELFSYGIEPTEHGLLEGLKHKDAAVRAACLNGLAGMAKIDRIQDIVILYDDPVRFVRISALRAIQAIVSRHSHSYADQIWNESINVPDQLEAAMLLNDLGDPSRYEVIREILQQPEHSMFVQAVRSVPKFSKYNIIDETGVSVDWIHILDELLKRDNLNPIHKMEILLTLRQIGSMRANSIISDTSEKETQEGGSQRREVKSESHPKPE